ncbi:hypothetical protein LCGC14_3161860, partial [marine sediment metagenome]
MPNGVLTEDGRTQLDGIVAEMEANNETEANIRFVVNDFKIKYGKKKAQENGIPPLESGISGLEAGVSERPPSVVPPMLRPGRKEIFEFTPDPAIDTGWGGIKKLPAKTIPQVPLDDPEKLNKKEDFEFWNYFGRKLNIGIDRGAAAILRTPETIYDVAINGFNLLLEGADVLTGAVGIETKATKLATTEELGKMWGIENRPAKQLEAYAEIRSTIDEKYAKPIVESIAKGDYKG